MKKLIAISLAVVLVLTLGAGVALAAGKNGQAGKSNVGHLYLYEKNPSDWSIVDGGAWGKYNYKLSGTGADTTVSGVFNGHGLVADESYSLIYYPEVAPNPWPATGWGVVVLGIGTANTGGNVHIKGTGIIGGPDPQPDVGDYIGKTGDKIWLVLSSDLTGSVMTGWTPAEYLFERSLINTP
jgi:hypothetical protein